MNWLQISRNSTPLYAASGVQLSTDAQRTHRETFFNCVDDVYTAVPMRFCLPHQVRCSTLTYARFPSFRCRFAVPISRCRFRTPLPLPLLLRIFLLFTAVTERNFLT